MIIQKVIYPKDPLSRMDESVQKKNFIEIKRQLKCLYFNIFCDYDLVCTINIKDKNNKSIINFRIIQNGRLECAYCWSLQNEIENMFEIELAKIKSIFEKYYPGLYNKCTIIKI